MAPSIAVGASTPRVDRSTRHRRRDRQARHLTRRDTAAVLSRLEFRPVSGSSGLLIHAELRAVVCSGVPRGRQQTHALVEARAAIDRARARRGAGDARGGYFQSHGPATVKDFRWSGLDGRRRRAASPRSAPPDRIRHGDRLYLAPAASPQPRPWRRISARSARSRRSANARASRSGRPCRRTLARCCCAACSSTADWPAAGRLLRPARQIRVEPLRPLTARERTAKTTRG